MVRGWLGKTLLGVLTLGMAGLTISSYFVGDSRPVVAEVNGKNIYKSEFDQRYNQQRQQIAQRMGANFDISSIDEQKLRSKVLKELVDQELIIQAANNTGFLVADSFVTKWQQGNPEFFEKGKFSQARYAAALQQAGFDPATFPEFLKSHKAGSDLANGLTQSAFALRGEFKRLAVLNAEIRDLHLTMVDAGAYMAGQSASDAEIKKYYDDHVKNFTTQDRVALDYIALGRDDFLPQATVTDDDLRARYADHIKNIAESRHAQHILITVDQKTRDADALKKITDIEKRARAGEDFGKLAKAFSQDPGSVASGGDLGFYSKGGGFVPPFEDALFALKPGEISAPVKTQFGYHLIKLLEIKKADVPTFESLRADLEKEAKQAKADELYSDAVEKLDAAVYEAADLKDPAATFKLAVQGTDPFPQSGGIGIAANRSVQSVAFSDDLVKEGKNSQAIRVDDAHTVWVRVRTHEPARVQTLAEVTAQVRGLVVQEKATAKAKSVADAVVKELNGGKSLADVAQAYQLHWTDVVGADRRNKSLTQEQLRVGYHLQAPAAGKFSAEAVPTGTAGFAVVALSKVTPGVSTTSDVDIAQMALVGGENTAQSEMLDYAQYLRAHAKIKTFDIKIDTAAP
jgi:peptidyl-prolyl cis-trans isomerase D